MPRLSCLLLFVLLSACGMKGDLYEVPPPASDEPELADPDKGDRKTIPPTPDPALSQ